VVLVRTPETLSVSLQSETKQYETRNV
jgi:hypothetical protein